MDDKFDQWSLNKVCTFVAKHNKKCFKSAEEVKREIYSRAQEMTRDGETMAVCGFFILRYNEMSFAVMVHSCILPDVK